MLIKNKNKHPNKKSKQKLKKSKKVQKQEVLEFFILSYALLHQDFK